MTKAERDLLGWLTESEFSQYGECHGRTLDALIGKGFAQIHGPGEHQSGFIAQDHAGNKDMAYRAVSITDAGRAALRSDTDDEYVVFLAKDNAFAAVLPQYLAECVRLGADAEQLTAVYRLIERVRTWREANPDRCKVPDAAGERLLD